MLLLLISDRYLF